MRGNCLLPKSLTYFCKVFVVWNTVATIRLASDTRVWRPEAEGGNAHPQRSNFDNDFVVVHNGILFPLQMILIAICALFVLLSQCCGGFARKNQAMEDFNKQDLIEYRMQSQKFMREADSLEDFTGKISLDSILHDKRKVFGKQPNDMRTVNIDWEQWPNVIRKTSSKQSNQIML